MNNKKLGTKFEQEVCDYLSSKTFWTHFITPDITGAQPFDVIAVKGRNAYAIDCKTCVAKSFSINRLEENQKSAFERWLYCGNSIPLIAVEYNEKIIWISYEALKIYGSVPLDEDKLAKDLRFIKMYDDVLEDFVICNL